MSLEQLEPTLVPLEDIASSERLRPLPFKYRLGMMALLILVTMVWGGTFLVTQYTIQLSGPMSYLAGCFSIGAMTLAIVCRRQLRRPTRRELWGGILIGLLLFVGYGLQTFGLLHIASSKSGFITGLYVPLVPLLSLLLLRQRPTAGAIIGVCLSFAGLFLISLGDQLTLDFGPGELLTLGCALAFALQIVCVSTFVPGANAINLTLIQLTTAALLDWISIPLTHEPMALPPLPFWLAILFMGIIDMCFCFLMMNRAQQYLSSTQATLIYALEPVWAGFFGLLAGQILSLPAWIGSACIFLGMIIGGLRLRILRNAWQRLSPRLC